MPAARLPDGAYIEFGLAEGLAGLFAAGFERDDDGDAEGVAGEVANGEGFLELAIQTVDGGVGEGFGFGELALEKEDDEAFAKRLIDFGGGVRGVGTLTERGAGDARRRRLATSVAPVAPWDVLDHNPRRHCVAWKTNTRPSSGRAATAPERPVILEASAKRACGSWALAIHQGRLVVGSAQS